MTVHASPNLFGIYLQGQVMFEQVFCASAAPPFLSEELYLVLAISEDDHYEQLHIHSGCMISRNLERT